MAGNTMIQRLEMKVLIDNVAEGSLVGEWGLSIMIDAGSTNELIDQIFESADDLLDGRMVCGAGGGGFLQAVLKKGVRREKLQKRLEDAFPGTEIRVWECTLT